MTLGDMIAFLEKYDPALVVPLGFTHPHSYRGYYEQLAFEPAHNVTVGEMLANARGAMDQTFQGYKGGDYKMDKYTLVNLAYYGSCGEEIGETLLDYMVGNFKGGA